MRFYDMKFLYFLILFIPALIAFYVYVFRRKKEGYNLFGNMELLKKTNITLKLERQYRKAGLIVGSIFFLILALARPQFGTKLVEIKRKGIDVVVALDVSLSMHAEDMKPNRLEVAKREIAKFSDMLEGDRLGLVVFAGNAFIQCPLTLDYSAFKMFLEILDTDSVPVPGTAIGTAITKAASAFSQKERKHKVLILFTDGEDHETNPIERAEEAAKQGVKIYTIGIGSSKGDPIPIKDNYGKTIGYKKDRDGKIVMSGLDENTLKKIALLTGGKYYHASSSEIELEKILKEISSMEKKELSSGLYRHYEERFYYFLFFSLILLVIEFFIKEQIGINNRVKNGDENTRSYNE
ncbi:MAG: VWA domain-containing protein [Candidatus Firestonebacteria bacterium]|nr:VWA domain-containing protein [Candidatus Firestonebacteria bacterium]